MNLFIMKRKVIPFTETDYPNGYSHHDCLWRIVEVTRQIDSMKEELKELHAERKELRNQMVRGGRLE